MVGVALSAALIGGFAVGVVLVIRERSHRRRVNRLFSRLGELEELLSQTDGAQGQGSSEEGETPQFSDAPSRPAGFRGRLSTVISSLRRRSAVLTTEPQRIDLRAIRYLYAHLEEQVAPSDLASELHVSLRTLQRHVTASLGCSPRDLIVAVKMHEAKRLLTSGDCQVGEAARAVGFDDAFHFSKRFRAYYGVAPSKASQAA